MTFEITDEETCRLILELTALTGEDYETAVRIAVEERLERVKANPKAGLARRLNEITRETSAIMNDGRSSKELMDELYDDETGLPK